MPHRKAQQRRPGANGAIPVPRVPTVDEILADGRDQPIMARVGRVLHTHGLEAAQQAMVAEAVRALIINPLMDAIEKKFAEEPDWLGKADARRKRGRKR